MPWSKSDGKPLLSKGDLDQENAETAHFDHVDRRKGIAQLKMSSIQNLATKMGGDDDDNATSNKRSIPRLADIVGRMNAAKKQQHKRNKSDASDLLSSISRGGKDKFEHASSNGKKAQAAVVKKLFQHIADDDDGDGDDDDEDEDDDFDEGKEQSLPFRHTPSPHYGSITDGAAKLPSIKTKSGARKLLRMVRRTCTCTNLFTVFRKKFLQSYFALVALPLFTVALVLYYKCGNPELDYLPGHATLSWWCNFAGRQIVTYELARFCQWLLIDMIMLGTRLALRFFGPFLTLFAIHAKGWPFIVFTWAVWDIFLMQGDGPFQVHWLYWTNWGIYSQGNSGVYILSSAEYMSVLFCMLIAGGSTTIKRFAVAVRFGRRQFIEFKPRLERILAEVVILNEIASLGAQAKDFDEETLKEIDISKAKAAAQALNDVRFSQNFGVTTSDATDVTVEEGNNGQKQVRERSASKKGQLEIKEDLDRWEEPINKAEDIEEVEMSDVLKFKRALTYMDDKKPFGEDFGPAGTRDECVLSAHTVFNNLISLTVSADGTLPFEVLELLAMDENGNDDIVRQKRLRKMFPPSRGNKLSLFSFVQTCDSTYKRLRYFKASIGNASVIDNVLEQIVNGAFFFVLVLLLLSLMQYNPWALLVSLTSLLVSISFALGPSLSKYVEGVLLIAVQRPYDLGDRICIDSPSSGMQGEGGTNTWFVEDINLTTTTLRFALTNEVCTLNNGSIFGTRIVNCNRSPNAMVYFPIKFHINIFDGDNLDKFVEKFHEYVADNLRTWESLAFCRYDEIDADNDVVSFVIAFRHKHSWQDAGRIKLDRAELLKYIHETAAELGVSQSSSPPMRVVYNAGVLEQGGVKDYRKNLLRPENIVSLLESEKGKKEASSGK